MATLISLIDMMKTHLFHRKIRGKRYGKTRSGCLVLAIAVITLIMLPYLDLYIGLLRISWGVDIRPSVSALQNHLDNSMNPNMSRDEVNDVLHSVGTKVEIANFAHEDEICDSIGLYIGYWPLNRLEYIICYDKEYHYKFHFLREPS